jgi:two-component system, cell cycle sensor histidine kinase and response regulator CckA
MMNSIPPDSQVGSGATVSGSLPTASARAAPSEAAAATPPSTTGELILLVEDEVDIRRTTQKLLVRRGFRVVEAANGQEAMVRYREFGKEIGVVITDLIMPVMDGPTFMRELRRINPTVPVVIMSGRFERVRFSPEEIADVQGFLVKPFTLEEFYGCLDRILHPGS